jgi:uncharacterized protein (DUF2267 family)
VAAWIQQGETMDYQGFITVVRERAGVPTAEAERAACGTLQTLSRRISVGEAEDIAERLPDELRSCVALDGSRQMFHLDGFIQRLEEQLGVDRGMAVREAKAVVAALWSTIGSEEFDDMRAELPKDFDQLLDEAVAQAPRPGLREATFIGPLSYDEWVDRVAELTRIDREQATRAIEAVLEVLAMRITAGQVEDLAPFVPVEFRRALENGVARSGGKAMRLTIDAFIREVGRRENRRRGDAYKHAKAVLAVLREAVGEKEFSDTVAQLPDEFRELLRQD